MSPQVDKIHPMFIEYRHDLLPDLARIHSRFSMGTRGYPSFPPEHWESIFLKSEIDLRNDLIISSSNEIDGDSKPSGFAWLYTKTLPTRILLQGPYVDPDLPDAGNVIESLLNESRSRAHRYSAEFLQARSMYDLWERKLDDAAFISAGAYVRMRLFPIRGDVPVPDLQPSVEDRKST